MYVIAVQIIYSKRSHVIIAIQKIKIIYWLISLSLFNYMKYTSLLNNVADA